MANPDYDGLNKKFKEIKFLPSNSEADNHFKTKNKSVSLETVPLPNMVETNEKPKNNSTSPTSTLNTAFNKLLVNNQSNEKPKTTITPTTPNRSNRNALLNNLFKSQQPLPSSLLADNNIFNQSGLENIEKLKKIDKLRVLLRNFSQVNRYTFDDKHDQYYVDIVELMYEMSKQLDIFIEYLVKQVEDCSYFGVLYLDKYKVTSSGNKKKKKCMLNTYRDAFSLLISNCTLAVRSIQNIGQSSVEYELYNIDGSVVYREQSITIATSNRHEMRYSEISEADSGNNKPPSNTNNKQQM